jgi:hypothetical protein
LYRYFCIAQQQVLFSIPNNHSLLRISTWCRNCVNFSYFSKMSVETEHDKSFPYFEEHNFSGWLIQFKAMLRELDCDEVIETPIPKDVDAAGNPIPMNARERQDFKGLQRNGQGSLRTDHEGLSLEPQDQESL